MMPSVSELECLRSTRTASRRDVRYAFAAETSLHSSMALMGSLGVFSASRSWSLSASVAALRASHGAGAGAGAAPAVDLCTTAPASTSSPSGLKNCARPSDLPYTSAHAGGGARRGLQLGDGVTYAIARMVGTSAIVEQ